MSQQEAFEVWCQGYGTIPAKFMFVGISASRFGGIITNKAFTKDASGRLLQRCLARLGLAMTDEFSWNPQLIDCYITNLVKGKCITHEGINRLPTIKEYFFWLPSFYEEVAKVRPDIIVCLSKDVFRLVARKFPKETVHSKHPRWYQSHGALSNDEAFEKMVKDYRMVLNL